MKPIIGMTSIVGCIAVSASVLAQSGEDVARSRGCFACHDGKNIGPTFKVISSKYGGNKDAETQLARVLKEGKGHPRIQATDAELKAVIQYVLKQ
jgi:cytochrome c551/c552